jgi:arylformamidase
MTRFFDVTRTLYPGMPVYPGDPSVVVRPISSVTTGAPANISMLRLGSHTGTHVDPPRHFFDGRAGVDELSLDVLIGPALVHELPVVERIEAACLAEADLAACPRILFKVSAPVGLPTAGRAPRPPGLTAGAAEILVHAGVRLVGLESLSADTEDAAGFPAHRTLLRAGVVILEGLDLAEVTPGRYELWCLPLKIRGGDGAPARVVLRTLD